MKDKCIAACREISARYRAEKIPNDLFDGNACPLCDLFYILHNNCRGCPLADKDGESGCIEFDTYKIAAEVYDEGSYKKEDIPILRAALEERAKFFDRLIPILEGLPASRFTPGGWEYLALDYNQ